MIAIKINSQTTYVVSVGINDYANIGDLKFCENDVRSFNKVFLRHTKQVYSLTGCQATHTNVISTLSNVFQKAEPADAVVLFFSGHGYPGGLCCYDMNRNMNGLDYTELQSIFRSCKAKRKMVFADACYSGGMRRSRSNSSINPVGNGNVMFFLSSRTNEVSQEMPTGPNGQFTRFLVRGLGGGSDKNRDRIVTAKELYKFVHDGVSATTYNNQHPVMWGKFNNTMTILNWKKRSGPSAKI